MTEPTFDDLPPIFRACAASEDGRYCRSFPFVRDGHVYATDGRIVVRMPWDGPNTHGDAPPVEDLTFACDAKEPLPLVTIPDDDREPTPCKECGGKGSISKCSTCDGDGEMECGECGQPTDCEDCDGRGTFRNPITCEGCDGAGNLPHHARPVVFADGCAISERFVDIVQRNGGRIYGPPSNKKAWYFTGDGWEGLVMPIEVTGDNPIIEASEHTQEATQ